jgi:NAD(P)-dependent dehydrogenase (short-subunit alcohol dehydrogenase family)
MGRLTGKTALITGGTTGIGMATAKLFMQEGARVAVIGQDPERVRQAGVELGDGALALRADVASRADMLAAAARLKQDFGTLDIVFANAGIAQPMPFSDVDDQNIDSQISVNLKGVIYTVQSMLPLMNNPSSIVLTSTTMIEKGIAGMSVYAATKAAVRSLARTLSAEFAPRGVRVNVISPGLVDTPIYGKLGLPPEAVQAWAAQLLATVPAARFGQADEVARAVLFLASDDSSYMMGENLLFDGGVATM